MLKIKRNIFSVALTIAVMVALLFTAVIAISHSSNTTEAAGDIIVLNGSDSGDGSLRAILASAQDGDTITFDPSVTLVTLTSGEISFSQANITINGGGIVTIERSTSSGDFRLLNSTAAAGTLTLKGLTFQNGKIGSGTTNSGGGIHVNSAVTAENCFFNKNSTGSTGGGIYAGGAVSMTNCTFSGNTSTNAGAGLYVGSGDAILTGCIFDSNKSSSAGGGVYTNSNVTLDSCIFLGNVASGGNGGGLRSWGNVAAYNCLFDGNSTTNSSNASGGGIWSNNSVSLNACVFMNNIARIHGSGVSASNASLMVLTNCTFANNKPYTTNPTDVGAIDCATNTYIFHCTIANNSGGGVYASTGKNTYLYNSILTGNTKASATTLLQMVGSGNTSNVSSLVEGTAIPGGTDIVTGRLVFGINSFDSVEQTMKVLSNGIAAGTAKAISVPDIIGYASRSSSERAIIDANLAVLNKDQTKGARATAGSVTYGAVEQSANALISLAIADNPATTVYGVGGTISLTGTSLDLEYTNGMDNGVPYTEPGMTNTSQTVDMSTTGVKTINFTFLGVTTSVGAEITVRDSTSTVVTSSGSTTVFGEGVTFYANVSPGNSGSGTPGGNVTFYDNGTAIGVSVCNAGVASITVSTLQCGSHTITATYEGNNCYTSSSSSSISHQVSKADTSIIVADVSLDSTGVTLKAHLSVVFPGSDTLTGQPVEFYVDGTSLQPSVGYAYCDASGDAILTIDITDPVLSEIGPGDHLIKAVFAGNGNLNGCESDELDFSAGSATTVISISADVHSPVYGQNVKITATLSVVDLVVDLTGVEVMLYDNKIPMASSPLLCDSSGVVSVQSSTLSVGSHVITAEFIGNNELNGCAGIFIYIVGKANTDLGITVPSSSVYGQNVIITTNVSVRSPGSGDPTGMTVMFYDGPAVLGSSIVSGGVAVFETSCLSVGMHDISAILVPNGYLSIAASTNPSINVAAADTETKISAPIQSIYGDAVNFTATVTVTAPGAGIPTGAVTFYDGANILGTGTLSNGTATFSTNSMNIGSYSIRAVYAGDGNYSTSESDPVGFSISVRGTVTSLSSTHISSAIGEDATFIAKVTSQVGHPTGVVEFYDGDTTVLLGTGILDADCKAAFSTDSLSLGKHTIIACYAGDGNFDASQASCDHTVSETVGGGVYYITATADGNSTIDKIGLVTVTRGNNQTFTFSAVSGYHIVSVLIDGIPLSQAQIDAGSYTFSKVMMNHSIQVASAPGAASATTVTLTISVSLQNGGYAEYSIDGGQTFTQYTSTVTIQIGSNVSVRADANDGFDFQKWTNSSTTTTTSDLSLGTMSTSTHLTLYFMEKGQGGHDNNDGNIWWWVLAIVILLIIIGIIIWFIIARRRRRDEEEQK